MTTAAEDDLVLRTRYYEKDGSCPFCAVGSHEFCSMTARAKGPCTCWWTH